MRSLYGVFGFYSINMLSWSVYHQFVSFVTTTFELNINWILTLLNLDPHTHRQHEYVTICLPSQLNVMFSTLVCGIIVIHSTWHGTTFEVLHRLTIAAGTLGMATQVYSTSVIAWKIWNIGVANSAAGKSTRASYKAIIAIVLESGAIYTALMLPLTVTYAIGSIAAIALVNCLDLIAVSDTRAICLWFAHSYST